MADTSAMPQQGATAVADPREERRGFIFVFLAALFWSSGGAIDRFVMVEDSWTVVFWRMFWAAVFLGGFMLWRDGLRGSMRLFAGMGWPGVSVAACFCFCATAFVLALGYTTVANILLIQAAVPFIAALFAWMVLGERISGPTWIAIGTVLVGVGIMVSESFGKEISPIGDALALGIAIVFSIATVITRRYAHVRMVPATCLATAMGAVIASTQAASLAISGSDIYVLFLFGAVNLGLGLALFTTGARVIPAAFAALIATLETILGPFWVWLIHAEVPSLRVLIGGAIVMVTLFVHIGVEFNRLSRPARPGVTGIPAPH